MLQKKLFPARPILPGYKSAGRFLIAVSLRENSTSKCALKPRDKLGVVTHICTPRTWEAEAGKVPQVRGHPKIRSYPASTAIINSIGLSQEPKQKKQLR